MGVDAGDKSVEVEPRSHFPSLLDTESDSLVVESVWQLEDELAKFISWLMLFAPVPRCRIKDKIDAVCISDSVSFKFDKTVTVGEALVDAVM